MNDMHSCSYFCDRPACIKAQRDELRAALAANHIEDVLGMVQPAEPVAWVDAVALIRLAETGFCHAELSRLQQRGKVPLYAAPAAVPLTATEIMGAVARGWCHPDNAHKEMDATLALAIAAEVNAVLAAAGDKP